MPVTPSTSKTEPHAIWLAGHSFLATTVGVLDQRYRIDSFLRGIFNIQAGNTTNRAISGSVLVHDWTANLPQSYGAYPVILQQIVRPTLGNGPYYGHVAAAGYVWGVNDLGNVPTTGGAAGMTQITAAFIHAMRSMISRHRASATYEDTWTGSAGQLQVAYGSNWTTAGGTSSFSSGTSIRGCSSTTTNNVITVTLPSDYKGEPVAFGFIGQSSGGGWGAAQTAGFGGTVTFGGTALTTGNAGGASASNGATFTTSNIVPVGTTHVPLVFRVNDLDATAAGKTITITCTAVDTGSGAKVYYDYCQLESLRPPAVVVGNIARSIAGSTSLGYGSYSSFWTGGNSYWKGQATPGSTGDADVAAANAALVAMVAEFDGRVRIADLDSAIGGNLALLNPGDQIHPNVDGARAAADAMARAFRLAMVANDTSATETPFPGGGALRIGRTTSARPGAQQWYTPDHSAVSTLSTATTPAMAAGDMFAMPFYVSEMTDRFDLAQLEATAAPSVAGTFRVGLYDDEDVSGYPGVMIFEASSGGAVSSGTTAGFKATPGFTWPLDFGLYWWVVKLETVGTGLIWRAVQGPSMWLPEAATAGLTAGTAAWKIAGQAAGVLPAQFPASAAPTVLAPKLWVRRL
jgi:hypothetical protein